MPKYRELPRWTLTVRATQYPISLAMGIQNPYIEEQSSAMSALLNPSANPAEQLDSAAQARLENPLQTFPDPEVLEEVRMATERAEQLDSVAQARLEEQLRALPDPEVLEEVSLESLSIDGICGVY